MTSQYTVRAVPPDIDQRLRREAKRRGIPLNTEILDALKKGLGIEAMAHRYSDLDDLIGSWVEDPEFDRAVADMDKIDKSTWI